MIDSVQLSQSLTERFGLEVYAKAEQTADGQKIVIRPKDIEYTISFQVEIILGWRTVSAVFKPGNFAVSLIQNMRSASLEQKAAFSVFAGSLILKGAKVNLSLDGIDYDCLSPKLWPAEWSSIKITMKKIGVVIENEASDDFKSAFPWATGFFGMSLSLLPLEEIQEKISVGETEGADYYTIVKKYERSRINRAACIEINGTDCKICGFNFKEHYGNLGEGYIHIHHVVPISQLGKDYLINPATDLIPLCPNCHAMIHKTYPPLTLPEMKKNIVYRYGSYAAEGETDYQ